MTGWRAMRANDLDAIVKVAEMVHPNFPERPEILADKFKHFPNGCLALDDPRGLVGYIFAHPWDDSAPALDAMLGALPAEPTTLYVHDVALAPAARGRGAGRAAILRLSRLASAEGLPSLSLVAVSGSAPVWSKLGFAPVAAPDLVTLGYGPDAVKMRCLL